MVDIVITRTDTETKARHVATVAGGALVMRLIADARAAGQRIVLPCRFLRAQAQRHKADWAEVIQW